MAYVLLTIVFINILRILRVLTTLCCWRGGGVHALDVRVLAGGVQLCMCGCVGCVCMCGVCVYLQGECRAENHPSIHPSHPGPNDAPSPSPPPRHPHSRSLEPGSAKHRARRNARSGERDYRILHALSHPPPQYVLACGRQTNTFFRDFLSTLHPPASSSSSSGLCLRC